MGLTFPLPIRIRLALWFFFIFAAAMFVLALLNVWMVHSTILSLEDNELRERVLGVERFLASRPLNEPLSSLESAMTVYDVSHGGKWLQVIGEDGRWIHRSKAISALFPILDAPQKAGNRERFFEFSTGDVQVRALIAVIHVHGRSYTVQTGMTITKRLHALGNFRLHLMALTPIILLAAGVVGYFASYKALSPVAFITREARRISSKNLDARLPLLKTHDELADMTETLNQMLDRIDAGYRSVREFTANAAHELRTPLSLIRSEAEIALAFARSEAENREALEHIGAEAIRMGGLVDDLLALARTDAGVQSLSFQSLDLNQIVHTAATLWSPQLRSSALELCVSVSNEDALIWADRPSIERLVDILLENACKYSPQGGQIHMRTSGEPDAIVLSVADPGIGISADHRSKIFERFYRANEGSEAGTPGSGLGLALARGIAEVHNARIEVRSELGQGSCFSVRFERIDRAHGGPGKERQSTAESKVPFQETQ